MTDESWKQRLPYYRCHKEVRAMKIIRVTAMLENRYQITGEVDGHEVNVGVKPEYISKHVPIPGGYYVLYGDGYESFSPAGPFEAGYTLL